MKITYIKPLKTRRSTLWTTAHAGLLAALMLAQTGWVSAREFREINAVRSAALLPGTAVEVDQFLPIAPELVQQAVEQIMASWATPQMQEYLSQGFYDKQRLEDVIDTLVPRDATIRIMSVQGIQTLQQYTEEVPGDPEAYQRVSRVSVTVRTQLEYNDDSGMFITLPGTTEYILKFKEIIGGYEL